MGNQPTPKTTNSAINWVILVVILVVAVAGVIYEITRDDPSSSTNTAVNQNTNSIINGNVNINSHTSVDTSIWKTYSDATYQFTLKYPNTWSFQKYTNGYNNLGSYVIAFTTKRTNTSYLPTVSVKVGWSVVNEINRINTSDPPYTKVTKSEQVNIGNSTGTKLSYTSTEGTNFQEFIIINGQQTFIFDSLADDTDFEVVASTFLIPSVDTSGWKTYTNTKYGLLLKYPNEWKVYQGEKFRSIFGAYKSSTTQTYPSVEDPMDAFISMQIIENERHLTLQKIFNKQYDDCLNDPSSQDMGCPGPEDTSKWKKVIIGGKEAIRSGKRGIPEGLPTDSVYINRGDYFLEISGTYYNLNNTYDFAPVFENILSTLTFLPDTTR
jgi:hypothetical protein